MPAPNSHLRRWFALAAVAAFLGVAAVYIYAHRRVQNALKEVPSKMGFDVQQSANGFTISKSEKGRTVYRVVAKDAVQFKPTNLAELHHVEITLYGQDSSRFDRIYGKDFEYDQKSGNITGKGEVDIDLESNPKGSDRPDQAPPGELRNPIHLKTSALVFNQKSGDFYTDQRVDFVLTQATGSSVGMAYAASIGQLTLKSQVYVVLQGSTPTTITGSIATMTKKPPVVVIEHAHLKNGPQTGVADHATLFLRPDNSIERVLARGNVTLVSSGAKGQSSQLATVRCEQLEMFTEPPSAGSGTTELRRAVLSGGVQFETGGPQPMRGTSGHAVLFFAEGPDDQSLLTKIHAEQGVKMVQQQHPSAGTQPAQDLELTAPTVDFLVKSGRLLDQAETFGPPQIVSRPDSTDATDSQKTVITAGKFIAKFDDLGALASVHGTPEARVVSQNPGKQDTVSTSHTIDALFDSHNGIQVVLQDGNFIYGDGELSAWSEHARYTPGDQIVLLTGSPRSVDGGMGTTAHSMRINRANGKAYAEGDVKSTYTDLKANPKGGLVSPSSPIHVTAQTMNATQSPAIAIYTGNARLWQDGNRVEAPYIEFDREHSSMTAHDSSVQRVSTYLTQIDSDGQITNTKVMSDNLTYFDQESRAHYEGAVRVTQADMTVTSREADVFFQKAQQGADNKPAISSSRIDRIVAREHVVLIEPNRRGHGEQLVYTSSDDKFVLTGGPPSIFDAEQGEVTGVSLTLFRGDDRVVVEGSKTSPTLTKTRVAR